MTDIVSRLRIFAGEVTTQEANDAMNDAADEIEQLRHQLETARTINANIKESRVFWINMTRRYARMIHGE